MQVPSKQRCYCFACHQAPTSTCKSTVIAKTVETKRAQVSPSIDFYMQVDTTVEHHSHTTPNNFTNRRDDTISSVTKYRFLHASRQPTGEATGSRGRANRTLSLKLSGTTYYFEATVLLLWVPPSTDVTCESTLMRNTLRRNERKGHQVSILTCKSTKRLNTTATPGSLISQTVETTQAPVSPSTL